MTHEKRALLMLHLTPGIGGATLRTLLSHFGTASNVLEQNAGDLLRINGIGRALANAIRSKLSLTRTDELLARSAELGIRICDFKDESYPALLREAADAPLILFSRGKGELNRSRSLSIVGTRKPTSYGLGFVKELISGLKEYDPLIVSGLAYGIDLEAHKVALREDLPTTAVLASGVNIIYPSSHSFLAPSIMKSGNLVSEYPPDELPEPGKFPARNRIIAGMTEATVVVEAARKGGALITAGLANDYDREVFALPGDLGRPYSKGTNDLIKGHKARILTEPEDVVYALGWDTVTHNAREQLNLELFDDHEQRVIKLLLLNPELHIDHLSWKSEIPLNRLASVLLNLEFNGFVNSLPGKKYKLAVR